MESLSRSNRQTLLGAVSLAIGASILAVGLWPFSFHPHNGVSWLRDRDGLRFEKPGIAYGEEALRLRDETRPDEDPPVTIQLILEPKGESMGGLNVILSFSDSRFQVAEWMSEFLIRARVMDRSQGQVRNRELGLPHGLTRGTPQMVTITSGPPGICIYRNGSLAQSYPNQTLTGENFVGRLVLGNSPTGTQAWAGVLLGLAVHRAALTPTEVSRAHRQWSEGELAAHELDEREVARFRFGERSGERAHNEAGDGSGLVIARSFAPLRRTVLDPPWHHLRLNRSHITDIVLNVLAFIPFALALSLYLSHATGLGVSWICFWSITLGGFLSLVIELTQVLMPSRASSLTDLICNTAGSLIGVLAFRLALRARRVTQP